MAENPHKVTYELSRELTLFQLTMMGIGMMIGAGVFLGIGKAIPFVGPGGIVLTFALNTILATGTAFSYAELSSAVPRAGGAYNFARIGFGRGISFSAGWIEWFASSVAGSIYAITFSKYTLEYLKDLGLLFWLPLSLGPCLEKGVTILIALFFIYINYRGASETGFIGAVMTLGQTIFLLFIGGVGLYIAATNPERLLNFKPFMPKGWLNLFIAMGFTYVAFEGFEVISQAGDEAIAPRKNLPKAMIYSVFIVGITYILVSFASVVAVNANHPDITFPVWEWIGQFGEMGFKKAIERLFPFGNFFLTLAVIFASTSALNATIFSAARASYALGRDRMLPAVFAKISKKRKTPSYALVFSGVIILCNAVLLPTKDVASSASIMFLFLFFLVNICVIRIRLNMGDELTYGFVMPFFPLFPLLAIGAQALLAVFLIHMSWLAWIIAPCWIAAGIVIYHFYSKSRVVPSESEIVVIEEEIEEPAGDKYRVMVPIANPNNALSLVGTTIKLSRNRDARIDLLHMVAVPDQIALSDAEKYVLEGKEGIVEAMLYLMPRFPVTTAVRHCRNIARGIVSAVREKRVDLLIMGWHGSRVDKRFVMGSTLDKVISRSPCDIVILKDCGNRKFYRVLVPIFGSSNDGYALRIADSLTESEGEITLLLLRGSNKDMPSERYVKELIRKTERSGIKAKMTTIQDNTKAVLEEAEGHDLLVLGIIARKHSYNVKKLSFQEKIAHRYNQSLVIVNEAKGIASITKRWF
ncbi:MAG: amino acid permease [Spirochaetales bacterium]|nr:amino acid permease [Spirochaetales bacterium]